MGAGMWINNSGMNGFDSLDTGNIDSSRSLPLERQGSLTHAQQTELMDVLENEGIADIDSYLSTTGIDYSNNTMGNTNMGMNW
jgi:hypothetical protein